jgi:hypothetical protein
VTRWRLGCSQLMAPTAAHGTSNGAPQRSNRLSFPRSLLPPPSLQFNSIQFNSTRSRKGKHQHTERRTSTPNGASVRNGAATHETAQLTGPAPQTAPKRPIPRPTDMRNGLYGLPRTYPLALRPTRTRNGHEMAQSLPQGLRACQKGHVDPTLTPHGPTPFPRPTSTPNGARRCQTAHPLSLRLTNMVSGPRTTRPLPPGPRAGHVDPTSMPHGPPLPPRPTSVPNGAHAPQPTHSLATNSPDGHKRHVCTPNGAHRAQTAHPLSLRPPSTLQACEVAHVDPRMLTCSL